MIRISPLFFITLIVLYFLNLLPEFLIVTLVSLAHETGHYFTAKILNENVSYIKVQPWGICLRCEHFKTYKSEMLVSLAGPMVNIILLLISSIFKNPFLYAVNLFMLVLNLLPIYPLDGGRILSCALKQEINNTQTDLVLKIVSSILTVVVFLTGIYLFYKTKLNFSVLLAGLFILLTTDKSQGNDKKNTLKKVRHYSVMEYQTINTVFKLKDNSDSVIIDVLDEKHRYLGSITAREVLEEIAVSGYEIKFIQILQKHLLY